MLAGIQIVAGVLVSMAAVVRQGGVRGLFGGDIRAARTLSRAMWIAATFPELSVSLVPIAVSFSISMQPTWAFARRFPLQSAPSRSNLVPGTPFTAEPG